MNSRLKITLGSILFLSPASIAHADVIIDKGHTTWSMLNSNVDPAIADTDFNATWFNPTVGGYTGLNYDGPAFTSAQSAPFQFDSITGLSGGTTLTHKVTSYFYLIIDGGSMGFDNLKLSLLADDGAFVYLNGVLIARDSISDPDTYSKFSSSTGNENNFDNITLIDAPKIIPGDNLLAISIHNRNATSTDLGFDLKLEGDPILVNETATGWAMLSPIDPSNNDGYDPVVGHGTQTADADYNATWRNQSYDGYTGGAYNGPAFTTGQQAPFQYGGVDGITDANTTIPQPDSGSRGSAYFIKTIDGGVTGYDKAEFTVLADDGAYIYLNGNLVGVVGDLPNDPAQDTWGRETGASGDESAYHTFTVSGTNIIQPGANLLAVSLHQTNLTSSDLGFRLRLVGQTLLAPTILRGPYLQSASDDRMTVKWRTSDIGNSILRYGDAPDNLTQTVTLNSEVTEHEITLADLTAATKYYYQIESTNAAGTDSAGADTGHYFQTHPAPGSRTPTRVWVIGDSGTVSTAKNNVYNSYLTRTGSAHTDIWLLLGDNAYNTGSDTEFQNAMFNPYASLIRKTTIWSTFGNHESNYGNANVYDDIFKFPTAGECGGVASGTERYYSFDHGNIHFVCVDSETDGNYDDTPGNGGMIDWLELDLQSTDKDWIIAYFHHGPYTKGSHDSDTESHHIQMRRYVTPLLEKYGVDLVLGGHSHCYERSMLINGHHSNMSPTQDSSSGQFVQATHSIDSDNGSNLGSVDGTTGTFLSSGAAGAYEKPLAEGETGTIYSICGASGKLSAWDNGSSALVNPAPHPVFIVNLRVMGSMVLTIDGNSMNAQYIDDSNVIRDDFTIVKGTTIAVTATDDTLAEHGTDDTATFTLTRSGATSFAENVTYQISGSAANGVDYSPVLSGTVSFAADETSKLITVTRATDFLAEGDENLGVTIAGAQQAAGTTGVLRDRYFLGNQISATVTLADKPSQNWWFNQYGAATLTNSLWNLDTDNDGLDRLQEYAWGGTTGVDDRALLPTHQFTGSTLELLYTRNNSLADLTYRVLTSTDLSMWTETGVSDTLNGTSNPTGVEPRKGSVDVGTHEHKRFLRLSISQ
ncbi:MAG: metallophosphoesterase [Akkermansiaceae bacterium]